MREVTVRKNDLIEQVKTNREKHAANYEEATKVYRARALHQLRHRAAQIEADGEVDLQFKLPAPREFLSEYDQALAMLEWETGEMVTLDDLTFQNLVLDEWAWKNQYAASTQSYLAE